MTNDEVNKIIAEYMDIKWSFRDGKMYDHSNDSCGILIPMYTNSIDALVPVWDKLNTFPMFDEDEKYLIELLTEDRFSEINYVWAKADTIQEAAAHATAKAIKELE